MQNFLKRLRRKLFGLDEQEAALHRAIADTNELIVNTQKQLQQVQQSTANTQKQLQQVQQSINSFHYNYSRTLLEILAQNQPNTVVSCLINDVPLQVSVDILRSYIHCLHNSPQSSFTYYVETHCSNWLAQHIEPGDVFLDVGAAFGVISFSLTQILGNTGHIYAFEPARQTRERLQKLVTINHIDNLTVVPCAIADQVGTAEFIEYSNDNRFSWAADTSTLAEGVNPSLDNYSTYSVDIITLDQFVQEKKIKPKAIKIDIEGFELYALQGASHTLNTLKPYLCIDIHKDVKTKQSALLEVQPLLEALDYSCRMEQHTLFASPEL